LQYVSDSLPLSYISLFRFGDYSDLALQILNIPFCSNFHNANYMDQLKKASSIRSLAISSESSSCNINIISCNKAWLLLIFLLISVITDVKTEHQI
jgi:hypothetical protein